MPNDKLKRDTFIYLSPKSDDDFAQCSTCRDWVRDDHCRIHGPDVDVPGTASCCLYVWGWTLDAGTPTQAIVTPIESGLVDRDVRCENCKWFEANVCMFFDMLNTHLPDVFDLDDHVEAKGCCNAQQPKTD